MSAPAWKIDPDDPRAPPHDVWMALTPEERERVVASLPSEFPISEAEPPEGDLHFVAKKDTRDTLDSHFARLGRRVYLACELPVYYPGERMFAPDVMAVLDVERRARDSWVVDKEGKGLDLALEILVSGRRRKDLTTNVERYARLGIPEYFVFDRRRLRLSGYRLPSPGARAYQPIVPQLGRYPSHVLGLDLRLDGERLRFLHGHAAVPDANELIASLESMMVGIEERAAAAEERASTAEERASTAEERLAEVERQLAEARAEIARLKGERQRD